MNEQPQITRFEAIDINRDKSMNPILLYVKDIGPIYEKDIGFLSKDTIRSNARTFIMTNRQNIAFANQQFLFDKIHDKNKADLRSSSRSSSSRAIEIKKKEEKEKNFCYAEYKRNQSHYKNMLSTLVNLI